MKIETRTEVVVAKSDTGGNESVLDYRRIAEAQNQGIERLNEVMKLKRPKNLAENLQKLIGNDSNVFDEEMKAFLNGNIENLRDDENKASNER